SRALEVYEQTGITITQLQRQRTPPLEARPFAIVLDPPLPELRRRIEARVTTMMREGFLEEVRLLRAAGYGPSVRSMQALGYKQLGAHLDGLCTLDSAVTATVSMTVAYARRQRTWFRKE